MKKSVSISPLVVLLVTILPLLYTASIYSSLPDTIPTHFNLSGTADRFGHKSNIWLISALMAAVSLFVYLLFSNLPKINPKRAARQSPELFRKIGLFISVFICAVSLMLLYATKTQSFHVGRFLLPLIGLLFLVMGNYMHSVKPNYFIGFRVSWTLNNEDNWRKTHQAMGKLWVAGGLAITLFTLLLPVKPGAVVFALIMSIMIIAPGIYSYNYFRNHQQRNA